MNYQNTVVFILLDPPEKEEEYLDRFTKNNDYVEKPKINIMTDLIEYILVEVKTQKKHIDRRSA